MINHIKTLTDHILEEERKNKIATGSLTVLLMQIQDGAKIINHHVRLAGLTDILGDTGKTNSFNEEVQKLDDFADTVLSKTLLESGQVHAIASEEHPEIVYASKSHRGDYIVFFDPLDGSSNIDINCPIGTIFSIYHKDKGLLQPGKNQVAAGYIMYGSSTMFVYASAYSINGFTLDPGVGTFLLSHPTMTIPAKGTIYSINEGNFYLYDNALQAYLDTIKKTKQYKCRSVGAMVADIHRTILKGGIFLYPRDEKQKDGKLRLLFEVNPMSFLIEKAGGMAISDGKNPLEIMPTETNQQLPIVMGSRENVEEYMKITQLS